MSDLNQSQRAYIGKNGTTFMTSGGGAYTTQGPWGVVECLADTVFTTLTDAQRDGAAIGASTFYKGQKITGYFTEVNIASGGPCIGYKD